MLLTWKIGRWKTGGSTMTLIVFAITAALLHATTVSGKRLTILCGLTIVQHSVKGFDGYMENGLFRTQSRIKFTIIDQTADSHN